MKPHPADSARSGGYGAAGCLIRCAATKPQICKPSCSDCLQGIFFVATGVVLPAGEF
ncbi:hypothetical protein [Effusibacillus pohliae]|uniref:hypothetical protein n=1 Tax=Effusibacillus pohliae TaxID=232270 RepID=UPI00037155A8|nr:hypothetical protein [Effusibacillus pohliae]